MDDRWAHDSAVDTRRSQMSTTAQTRNSTEMWSSDLATDPGHRQRERQRLHQHQHHRPQNEELRHAVPQPSHQWPQEPQQPRRSHQLMAAAPFGLHAAPPPACRFIHDQCDKQLFGDEYLRSNKASGHKNLRCFPHCCRGHNPKSFCGSGLLVECADPRVQVALGRFEEANRSAATDNQVEDDAAAVTNHDAILLGHTYARDDLTEELKTQENPFGRWFNGSPVTPNESLTLNTTTSRSSVFLLNGNRQSWHYGWQSSRLNCKNHHVFKVYFFQALDASMTMLQCLATLQSPPFRVSSSRKARKPVRSQSIVSDDAPALAASVLVSSPDRMSVDSQDDATTVPTIRVRSPTVPLLHSRDNVLQLPVTPSNRTCPYDRRRDRYRGLSRAASLQDDSLLSRGVSDEDDDGNFNYSSNNNNAASPRAPRRRVLSMSLLLNSTPSSPSPDDRRPRLSRLEVPPPRAPVSMDGQLVETPVSNMQQLRLQESEATAASRPLTRASSFSVTTSSSSSSSAFSEPSSGRSASFGDAAWFSEEFRGRWVDDDSVTAAAQSAPVASRVKPRSSRYSRRAVQLMRFISPNDDWTVLARARLLAVAFNIVNSIERVTEIVAPDGELQRVLKLGMMASSPRDKELHRPLKLSSRLEAFLNVLVTVAQSLFQDDFLLRARDRMQDLARQNAAVDTAYEHALRLVEQRVDEATAMCLDNSRRPGGVLEDGSPHNCRALAALLRSYEDEIQAAPWWRDGSWLYTGEPDQSGSPLPYLAFFRDYYDAVCASVMFSPLSMPPPSAVSAIGLSGVWRLVNADRDIPAAASHDAGHPAYPFSWFQQQLQGFISQIYCIVETDTKMTLTLGNSLVSSACPFFAELDHRDPLIEVPRDHFPYGCDRQNLLVAYKARRLRAIQDKSGSCVSVCSMRWPAARVSGAVRPPPRWAAMASDVEDGDGDDDGDDGAFDGDGDCDGDEHEHVDEDDVEMGSMDAPPRRLLRTRMTSTFSLLSLDRLQVNTIIEGSWTDSARLCAMTTTRPNAADMVEFYNTPGTWELMAKVAMQFDRISLS